MLHIRKMPPDSSKASSPSPPDSKNSKISVYSWRQLFGQNITLMTAADAYFSKVSPSKTAVIAENLELFVQKVTLFTNLRPPWSSYEIVTFLVKTSP